MEGIYLDLSQGVMSGTLNTACQQKVNAIESCELSIDSATTQKRLNYPKNPTYSIHATLDTSGRTRQYSVGDCRAYATLKELHQTHAEHAQRCPAVIYSRGGVLHSFRKAK